MRDLVAGASRCVSVSRTRASISARPSPTSVGCANRGYSRMQHLWFLERVVDICAHELGIPADEMRLRNYIRPEEFPYTTPNGCVYDSGNYPKMLDLAKNLIRLGQLEKQAG